MRVAVLVAQLSVMAASDFQHALHAEDATAPRPSEQAIHLIGKDAVTFDGKSTPLSGRKLAHSLATDDFTLGLTFQTESAERWDLGDLVSLWDAKTRHGFSLGLRNNTGSTTSQANWRQLQFGIDAGIEPQWRDEGRPGSSILGFSMAVHDGQLYVGTCEPRVNEAGSVYRYIGPGQWKSLGSPDGANSVSAMASFEGQLYVGTGKYRLAGSSLPESENLTVGGKVFRLLENDQWELVGDLAPTEAIAGLVSFDGKLFASSLYAPAGFFRYEGGTEWTKLPTPDGKRVEPLAVHAGALYAGSYDGGHVYRFDGANWQDLGLVAPDITQTYSFATYQNALHVATWPAGKVYRLEGADRWIDTGRLGQELEVMGMLVHNGVFYAGTLPLAEVYRYEGGTNWKRLAQLDTTPSVRYRRVWTMATFQGRLFATTLPSGKVWSMEAGKMITDDRELSPGWHEIIAQRKSGKLRLFVDGVLTAESNDGGLNLNTQGLELRIGEGPRGRFVGKIRDLWVEIPTETPPR